MPIYGGSNGDHKSKFSEKVAIIKDYQYDGDKNGAQWRLVIRPYLISRAPVMAVLLQNIENNEDQPALVQD